MKLRRGCLVYRQFRLMPEKPVASILIPCLPAPEYLDVALTSVMPQARAAGAEVIVISDGPHESTAAVAERHGARLVALPRREGLNRARNAGLGEAAGELLVFIDQDVEAPSGWLDAMLEGARAYPEYEVFGGPITARLENGLHGCGREPPPITTLDAGPHDRDLALVWGANMAIRRSAFDRIGWFDDALSGRGDEEEWELRYAAAGGRIRYLARAGLYHRRSAADARLGALVSAAYTQGREVRRHGVRIDDPRPLRAELRTIAGCAWHTIRRRCPYGIVMGARAAGAVRETLRRRT